MQFRNLAWKWLGLFTVVAVVTGCGGPKDILKVDAQGKYSAAVSLYVENCQGCHGTNLQGGVGPNLQHVGGQMSEYAIAQFIANGADPMPGFGPANQAILTNQQIQALATWLASKQ